MSTVYVFTQFGGPEHQELQERPVPQPGAGEMLVEVRAAGLNPADIKIREGLMGTRRRLPVGMGLEVAGVVVGVGEGVSGFAVGDEVIAGVRGGNGGLAEHTLVRAAEAVAKPAEVSFADAATLPVAGTTAYDLTHQVELEAGQSLLILGAGGAVGMMAAQIGKVHEFRVIGVAREDKREAIEATGATFVASTGDVAGVVRELAPEGVDLIVDLIGGQLLQTVAPLATAPDRVLSAVDPAVVDLGGAQRHASTDALEKITGVVQYGLVDPRVTATFPLERAGEAVAAVETGHPSGKVVVLP